MLVSRSSFFLVLHASRISYVLSCDASLTTIISVFCFSMAAVFMRSCTVFSRELSSLYAGTTRESQIPFFPFPFFSLFVFSIFAIFISLYFCYLFLLCPSLPLLFHVLRVRFDTRQQRISFPPAPLRAVRILKVFLLFEYLRM